MAIPPAKAQEFLAKLSRTKRNIWDRSRPDVQQWIQQFLYLGFDEQVGGSWTRRGRTSARIRRQNQKWAFQLRTPALPWQPYVYIWAHFQMQLYCFTTQWLILPVEPAWKGPCMEGSTGCACLRWPVSVVVAGQRQVHHVCRDGCFGAVRCPSVPCLFSGGLLLSTVSVPVFNVPPVSRQRLEADLSYWMDYARSNDQGRQHHYDENSPTGPRDHRSYRYGADVNYDYY